MNNERMEVLVLGRHLGTASGWDQIDDTIVLFYDFESAIPELIAGGNDLAFDSMNGWLQTYYKNGDVDDEVDAIETLKNVLRKEK